MYSKSVFPFTKIVKHFAKPKFIIAFYITQKIDAKQRVIAISLVAERISSRCGSVVERHREKRKRNQH